MTLIKFKAEVECRIGENPSVLTFDIVDGDTSQQDILVDALVDILGLIELGDYHKDISVEITIEDTYFDDP